MKTLKIICLCIMICVALCNTETMIKIKRTRRTIAPAEWLIVIISYLCVVLMLIMNII